MSVAAPTYRGQITPVNLPEAQIGRSIEPSQKNSSIPLEHGAAVLSTTSGMPRRRPILATSLIGKICSLGSVSVSAPRTSIGWCKHGDGGHRLLAQVGRLHTPRCDIFAGISPHSRCKSWCFLRRRLRKQQGNRDNCRAPGHC
jgi:hypothetical protein